MILPKTPVFGDEEIDKTDLTMRIQYRLMMDGGLKDVADSMGSRTHDLFIALSAATPDRHSETFDYAALYFGYAPVAGGLYAPTKPQMKKRPYRV